MRESNHNHPQQNRAAVCITSQLYDRRALDAPVSSNPLVSSLTHLAYLTSTSHRIRETLTVDGGLERLTAIALAALDGLANPAAIQRGAKSNSVFAPSFTPFAAYTQRGGGPHPPSSQTASTTPRPPARATCADPSSHLRALMITYTLSLQSLVNVGVRGSESVRTRCVEAGVLSVAEHILKGYFDEREMAQRKITEARQRSSNPKILRHRETSAPAPSARSPSPQLHQHQHHPVASTSLGQAGPTVMAPISVSPSPLAATAFTPNVASINIASLEPSALSSRANTPDGLPGSSNSSVIADDAAASSSDGEADQDDQQMSSVSQTSRQRRARSSTIKTDPVPHPSQQSAQPSASSSRSSSTSMDIQTIDVQLPVADNEDTEMGDARAAPPAASSQEDLLQGAALALSPAPTLRPQPARQGSDDSMTDLQDTTLTPSPSSLSLDVDQQYFFYRDDDLLLCLQLLAYLSKYPHVRAAFHHPCIDFACGDPNFLETKGHKGSKDKQPGLLDTLLPIYAATSSLQANIFSLVERYTVRPSASERDRLAVSLSYPLKFTSDISYWAGVIMRNACRKDEGRGGIRQCANMTCGAWETYPREFAKCRRCRKAKYCSKSCQSKAWQGGHRYWCSAREMDHETTPSRRAERETPRASTSPRWPYSGALAPLARLPEREAAALARYLESHPDAAQSAHSVAELVRRYQARHRTASAQDAAPGATPTPQQLLSPRPRPRANSLPSNTSPEGTEPLLTAAMTATTPVTATNLPPPATFLLRNAFPENDEEGFLQAQSDNMVQIAEPDEDHSGDLARVEGGQPLNLA